MKKRKTAQPKQPKPENHPIVPSDISAYTLEKQIGSGTQGKVFLARRNADGLEVAIKRLDIESVKTWKSYDLFQREAKVLKSLKINGIATFYDAFDNLNANPPCAYIVQEYIHGETLASLLKAGHRFAIDRVYDIIIQLLMILQQLHGHTPPVIHRDIKPSNIMLQPLEGDNFKVYLIDFGAVANPQLQSGGSTVAGTIGFMPPEQLMGKPVPQSDIYALAAVAVNLITGKSPVDMPVRDFHLIFEPDMQFMPVPVVDILRRMLEPDIENRLWNPELLIDAFTNFRKGCYDKTNALQNDMSDSDFEQRLKEVDSYAQPGNVELWQRLPEKRELYYPICYAEALQPKEIKEPLCFGTLSNVYKRYYNIKMRDLDEKYKLHTKEENVIGPGDILQGVFMFFLAILLIGGGISLIWVNEHLAMVLILPEIILMMVLPLFFVSFVKKRKARRATLGSDIQFKKTIDVESVRNYFFETLAKGRKTIATIVSIQYVNAPDHVCEQNTLTEQYAVHQRPAFKVEYKFNPPDDSDPNDLVHSIIVREAPENFLKVGDPLPILYRIHREGMNEYVYSIPFPILLADVEQLSDVLGQSMGCVERVCIDKGGILYQKDYSDNTPQKPKIRMNITSGNGETGDLITYSFE